MESTPLLMPGSLRPLCFTGISSQAKIDVVEPKSGFVGSERPQARPRNSLPAGKCPVRPGKQALCSPSIG